MRGGWTPERKSVRGGADHASHYKFANSKNRWRFIAFNDGVTNTISPFSQLASYVIELIFPSPSFVKLNAEIFEGRDVLECGVVEGECVVSEFCFVALVREDDDFGFLC